MRQENSACTHTHTHTRSHRGDQFSTPIPRGSLSSFILMLSLLLTVHKELCVWAHADQHMCVHPVIHLHAWPRLARSHRTAAHMQNQENFEQRLLALSVHTHMYACTCLVALWRTLEKELRAGSEQCVTHAHILRGKALHQRLQQVWRILCTTWQRHAASRLQPSCSRLTSQ